MLGKKKSVIFLFNFKMVFKTVETTHNTNVFDPETTTKHTVQWWFKQFCKRDKSLEYEEHSGWPEEVDNDQMRVTLAPI